MTTPAGTTPTATRWAELRRHYWQELWILLLVGLLLFIPWLLGLAFGVWFLWQQGWAWFWWGGSIALIALAIALFRFAISSKPHRLGLAAATPGASIAEQQAREALRQLAAAASADDLRDAETAQRLIARTFHAVALAHAPGDEAASWRFTLPELLLMGEDLTHRLRVSLTREFPVLRHVELTWFVKLYDAAAPAQRLWDLVRVLRWINPAQALLAELRGALSGNVLGTIGAKSKAQIAAILVEEAGEAAIKLYSGRYRRRSDELLSTAPEPVTDMPPAPLTILLAGRRNAGKSSLLNSLLGLAREPVGLLTPTTAACRAYEFHSEPAGKLILVDCPGADGKATDPWLTQATKSDLVLWVAAANRADRAADQAALVALDGLTASDPRQRAIPRVLVLTHADLLDPPMEWAPPYDVEHGQRPKEVHLRDASRAASLQLGIPPHRSVLVALPPAEQAWNLDRLVWTIADALPEARQKQLERGLRKDGWFKVLSDGMLSLPNTVSGAISTTIKGLRR